MGVGWFRRGNRLGIVFDYAIGDSSVRVLRFVSGNKRYLVSYNGSLRLPYYLRGSSKGLVGTEGVFDALRVKQYFPELNVFAFLGTFQTTKQLFISQLHRRLGGKLLFLLDDDSGGYKHANRIVRLFPSASIEFVVPDPDSAPDELLKSIVAKYFGYMQAGPRGELSND